MAMMLLEEELKKRLREVREADLAVIRHYKGMSEDAGDTFTAALLAQVETKVNELPETI